MLNMKLEERNKKSDEDVNVMKNMMSEFLCEMYVCVNVFSNLFRIVRVCVCVCV